MFGGKNAVFDSKKIDDEHAMLQEIYGAVEFVIFIAVIFHKDYYYFFYQTLGKNHWINQT